MSSQTLEEQRIRLLEDIKKLQDGVKCDDAATQSAEDLKKAYNDTVDQIRQLQGSRLGDPLQRLPKEIWDGIVLDTIPQSRTYPVPWHFDEMSALTLVSKSWRQSILSTPRFWGVIQVTSRITGLRGKIDKCLELSRTCPLRVEIEQPSTVWTSVSAKVVEQSARIRSIYIIGTKYNRYSHQSLLLFDLHVQRTLGAFLSLPTLEELILVARRPTNPNLDSIIERANSIKVLDGVEITPRTLKMSSMQKVRRLCTTQRFEEAIQFIPNLKHLVDISFSKLYHPYEAIPNEDKFPSTNPVGMEPLALKNLGLNLQRPGRIERIIPYVTSTLTKLSTSVSWANLATLLVACNNTTKLESLDLLLSMSQGVAFKPPASGSITTVPNLRSLAIQLGNPALSKFEPQDLEDKHGNVDPFFETLVKWAPNVTEFSIDTTRLGASMLRYASSLQNLRTLNLIQRDHAMDILPLTPLPTLESVTAFDKISNISFLQCTNALALSFSYVPTRQSSKPSLKNPISLEEPPYCAIDSVQWSNLRTLSVDGRTTSWEGTSLPCVETVRLINGYYGSICDENFAPSFYEKLIEDPTSFPALKTIEDNLVPRWDLLFIMLEKRNISMTPGLSTVSTLLLPAVPHPVILRPLVELLRGRITSRPPNVKLSLNEVSRLYLDTNISGCDMCHMMFWPCDTKIAPKRWQLTVPINPDLPPYPETEEEILSTNALREEKWRAAVKAYRDGWGVRKYSCGRHSSQDLSEITQYTPCIDPNIT